VRAPKLLPLQPAAGMYDKQLQRFVVIAQTRPRNGFSTLYETQLLVAVSQQASALGPYNVYQTPINFPGLIAGCPAPSGCFGDYPTLGADDNGIWWVDGLRCDFGL
jgi:hypothetical protein